MMINCLLGDDGVLSYEDTCSFTCDNGNELIVIGNRSCLSNGKWSGNQNFDSCKGTLTCMHEYTTYCKLSKLEKFCGFCGLIGNRKAFSVK